MSIEKVKWSGVSHSEWLSQRRGIEGLNSIDITRFGASDIGTIIGTSKYKCKRRLFYQMIGYHIGEWRTESSIAGHLLEPIVANMWEHWDSNQDTFLFNIERNIKLRKTKKAEYFLLNKKYPNMFCSIDRLHDGDVFSPFTGGLYDELTPIELKTTQSAYYKLWNNGITESYRSQVQAQMMLTETKVAVFTTLVSGLQFHVREVEYDSLLAEQIDYQVREFATTVKAGKQILDLMNSAKTEQERAEYESMLDEITPNPLELMDEQELNKELYGNSLGSIIGDESDFKYLLDYNKACEIIKQQEEDKQLAKNNLLVRMKDAEELKFEGGKVTWRRAGDGLKRDYFSAKLFK
jgi:predicted phage-related endonuclease